MSETGGVSCWWFRIHLNTVWPIWSRKQEIIPREKNYDRLDGSPKNWFQSQEVGHANHTLHQPSPPFHVPQRNISSIQCQYLAGSPSVLSPPVKRWSQTSRRGWPSEESGASKIWLGRCQEEMRKGCKSWLRKKCHSCFPDAASCVRSTVKLLWLSKIAVYQAGNKSVADIGGWALEFLWFYYPRHT